MFYKCSLLDIQKKLAKMLRTTFKDTHRESTLKLNSSAYEKYEYGHLGGWYIKLTLFNRF